MESHLNQLGNQNRRDFTLLWIGQFVSNTGDYMFYSVLLFLVLTIEVSHAGTKAGVVSFLETLPFLLFGPLVGAVVDRLSKRLVMITSDLLRMIVLLSFWPFWWTGNLHWWVIGTLAFIHTTFSAFFMPARDTFVPFIASGWLFRANALIQSSTQLAMLLGAFIAGILVGSKSSVPRMLVVLTIDALTFLASVSTLIAIKVKEPPNSSPHPENIWKQSMDGIRLIRHDRFLSRLLVLTAVDNLFIMGPAIVGANLLVKEVFKLGPQQLAFFQASMASGWLLGTFFLYFKEPKNHWLVLVSGILLDGFTYLPFLIVRNYSLALLLILIHGFFIPWITVSRTTLIQHYTDKNFLGRVFALVQLTVLGFTSLSSLLTGVIGDLIPIPFIFFIPGFLGTLTGLVSFWYLPKPVKKEI